MNRKERRALARQKVRRDMSGTKTREARRLYARAVLEAQARAVPDPAPTAQDLGLEVVEAKELLWTPAT